MDYSSVLSLSLSLVQAPFQPQLPLPFPSPHLRCGFSQPLPSITDPTRSAFVSSKSSENHLYSFFWRHLQFGEPTPLSHSPIPTPINANGDMMLLFCWVC